jgi:AGZA family xanthine/uracil permease-like MFS transporter
MPLHIQLKERGSCLSNEVLGGVASFLTVAYISPVISSMVAETGATCDLAAPDEVYESCRQHVRRQLLTSVALSSLLSTLLMGLWANLPFLLAPGKAHPITSCPRAAPCALTDVHQCVSHHVRQE